MSSTTRLDPGPRRTRRARPAAHRIPTVIGAATVVGLLGVLGGCASQGSTAASSLSPAEAMSQAEAHLDATSGIKVSLATDGHPSGDSELTSAAGVITTAPAFEGTASGSYKGIPASNIRVISVGGVFQVNLGIGGWMKLDPASLCAPDPATLLEPSSGIANVLTSATGLKAGSATRGGPDNKEVLTPYSGAVTPAAIAEVLPCSKASSYQADFAVDSDGYLRSAKLSGDFFGTGASSTFTITVEAYGVQQDITAP